MNKISFSWTSNISAAQLAQRIYASSTTITESSEDTSLKHATLAYNQ